MRLQSFYIRLFDTNNNSKQTPPQEQTRLLVAILLLSEGSAVPPVYCTSTFVFKNAERGKRAFQLAWGMVEPSKNEISPLIYSRVNNPNTNIVEDRLLGWDRAEAAAVFSSGMGAIACTCFALLFPEIRCITRIRFMVN